MRLLVLGGSVFLSKAVAVEARARGHDVTSASRGESGAVPDGVRHVVWDRSAGPPPAELATLEPDAVVDVARHPSYVRAAVAAWPAAHWVFVSTINVYADNATPGGRPGSLPLHEPILIDEDPASGPDVYGAMKVGCEELVRDGAASSMVVRPGLIVGPDDPSGRFPYWPRRLARGGEVLAPGSPDDLVQVVDARDLAAWCVDGAESRRDGVFDGVGHATPISELLAEVADGVGAEPTWTWVPSDFLVSQDVEPWAGERAVPLWLPRPEYDGMLAHDVEPALAAGLSIRPVADSARDTLAWLQEDPAAEVGGLTPEEEAEVLAAWQARG